MLEVIDIEDLLVWAYQLQKVDVMEARSNRDYFASGESKCGVAAAQRRECLGVQIDGGGFGRFDAHVDAVSVHRMVEGVCSDLGMRALVMECGRGGTRPPWLPGARTLMVPVLATSGRNKGQPKKLYKEMHQGGRVQRRCIGHEVRTINPLPMIEAVRGVYAAWWGALEEIAGRLGGTLTRYQAISPSALQAPWKN